MLTLRTDDTARVVTFSVTTTEPIRAYAQRQRGAKPATGPLFAPASIVLEFENGELKKVAVHGPRLTAAGRIHSTAWVSWNWPGHHHDGQRPFVESEPPQIVLAALKRLGYDSDGRAISP